MGLVAWLQGRRWVYLCDGDTERGITRRRRYMRRRDYARRAV